MAKAGEEEMNWIVDQYIQKVSDIISGVKKPQKTGEKTVSNMNGPHKSELCEACILGKCSQKDNASQLTSLMTSKASSRTSNDDLSSLIRAMKSMNFDK